MSGSGSGPLRYRVNAGVAHLTLDRPEKRNALDRSLVKALSEALVRAERDVDVRVLLLRGAGKDFCSGADLAELEAVAEAGAEASLEDARLLGALFVGIRRHSKPVLAAVHGRALAGGCGLAVACDAVLARDDAELGFPEVHLGFVPAMVMAILRRKVVEGRAFELVTRGDRIPAVRAEEIGLVTRLFPRASFDEDVETYAHELAERPATAVSLTKRLLYGLDGPSFEEGIGRGAEMNTLARLTEECRDGVRAFLERSRTSG